MRAKLTFTIGLLAVLVVGIVGFNYLNKSINGSPSQITEIEKRLKREMEEKYDISIIDNVGYYTNDVGYTTTFTTEKDIHFDARNRPDGSVDFYMEEVWRKKGLDKWGYADKYIMNVDTIDLNVGYRLEENKDIKQLTYSIEDVKDDLWLTIYIDLKDPFKEKRAKEIERGIYNYYQQLQKDDAEGVELVIRYNENHLKQDTGSYMITRNEDGVFPDINSVKSVSETFFK